MTATRHELRSQVQTSSICDDVRVIAAPSTATQHHHRRQYTPTSSGISINNPTTGPRCFKNGDATPTMPYPPRLIRHALSTS
ncbi:hypothetical protein GALMADRAFT_254680 [Galerina marginata CBS 339.88]|uniref:Uncharacterized protein n=1 Tax=Galerina marginata (strain CBS 339.88) TaxID=685588 RepID=A0A067SI57_GALM3|nr:hypothetical protein GALMADRAFT_254680 [Galerina marginata CBS 339.88]